MEQKCANCGNGKWRDGVTPITETCCTCHYVDKGALGPQLSNWIPKVQTNADRIRAMSDEELAENLYRFCDLEERVGYCKNLPECEKLLDTEDGIPEKRCISCLLNWLKQPAEGE